MTIQALFSASIEAKISVPCPAVHAAIDMMANSRWSGDRARMLECLKTFPRDLLFNEIMEGWVKPGLLEMATGWSRDQWIRALEIEGRG